ncbi:hypothetical protein E1176_04795, partial [Fulvivirga sp. RKSG066]|uniref:hypothetical protein n=1 Tax=Fulvivirga aurantia TaxID=2529383 RepID=UPI0012BB6012
MDSVRVKGRSFLILGDSSIYIEKDTVLVLPDSVASKLKRDEVKRSEEFYKNIKEKFYKRRFTKELYDLLFVTPPDSKPSKPTQPAPINGNYKKYEGKRIKNIRIKKLEVFGTSIRDTTKNTDSWAINFANSLHTYTRSRIVRNNLFFETGDIIDPDLLSDSERVLRTLPYVKDARVYVIGNEEDEEVEILVVIKDLWSISGEFDYGSLDRFDVALIDKNFFGLGQEFKNEFLYDADNTPKIGYSGTYSINNIYNTFTGADFYYARSEPLDRIGGRVYKNFITPETKYGGGLTILKERRQINRVYPDTTITFSTEYNNQDFWIGRSFLADEKEDGSRISFQIAARAARIKYQDRPVVEIDTNQQFFDSHLYLVSFAVTKRGYEKSSLISGFGRTEDIPMGYLAEFTTGRDYNEFYRRAYLGWRFSYGQFLKRIGYLRPTVSIGGFLRGTMVEQGVAKLDLQYFSFLYRFNKWHLRQFFSLSVATGVRRFDDEFININDRNGLRGLSYTFLRGTKKLTFSSETVAFTQLYFLGFRFAPFFFVDLGIINAESSKLFNNQLYQGYGIGVRLRNENLAVNAIQIRFAWYPVVPPGNS